VKNQNHINFCNLLNITDEQYQEIKKILDEKEESVIQNNLTDAQKEAENKLIELESKVKENEKVCESYQNELLKAQTAIEDISFEYDNLSLRTKIVRVFF
jgi:Spy/CpxP family protein refolding chaperone